MVSSFDQVQNSRRHWEKSNHTNMIEFRNLYHLNTIFKKFPLSLKPQKPYLHKKNYQLIFIYTDSKS